MTKEDIIYGLVKSCIERNPKIFISYLLNKNVKVYSLNKVRFYKYFKHVLICANSNSLNNWTLKIEKALNRNSQEANMYRFYDKKFRHARLNIVIRKTAKQIEIDVLPF